MTASASRAGSPAEDHSAENRSAESHSASDHSHVVRPAEMEWQATRFPGCEVKVLMFDRTTGMLTSLFRMAPGAGLPDHEHVAVEQTYVLEGSLVDREGPAAGTVVSAGEYVWREPGSRHTAWAPEGCTTLAIFQVPNRFYEADGRALDLTGQPWDELWGHLGAVAAE